MDKKLMNFEEGITMHELMLCDMNESEMRTIQKMIFQVLKNRADGVR
jgi:hypothetical protein